MNKKISAYVIVGIMMLISSALPVMGSDFDIAEQFDQKLETNKLSDTNVLPGIYTYYNVNFVATSGLIKKTGLIFSAQGIPLVKEQLMKLLGSGNFGKIFARFIPLFVNLKKDTYTITMVYPQDDLSGESYNYATAVQQNSGDQEYDIFIRGQRHTLIVDYEYSAERDTRSLFAITQDSIFKPMKLVYYAMNCTRVMIWIPE